MPVPVRRLTLCMPGLFEPHGPRLRDCTPGRPPSPRGDSPGPVRVLREAHRRGRTVARCTRRGRACRTRQHGRPPGLLRTGEGPLNQPKVTRSLSPGVDVSASLRISRTGDRKRPVLLEPLRSNGLAAPVTVTDMQEMKRLWTLPVLSFVAVALLAVPASGDVRSAQDCSKKKTAAARARCVERTATGSSTTTAGRASIDAPAPPVVYSMNGVADDGSTQTAKLEIWGIQSAAGLTPWRGWSAPSACRIDPSRDVIIPARATTTNTTRSFSNEVALRITQSLPPLGPYVLGEVDYSSGKACQGGRSSGSSTESSFSMVSNGGLAPGTSLVSNFYFVVPGYYSPNSPQGDPSMVSKFEFWPSMLGRTIRYRVDSMSGPGVKKSQFLTIGWHFTLNGTTATGS